MFLLQVAAPVSILFTPGLTPRMMAPAHEPDVELAVVATALGNAVRELHGRGRRAVATWK